MIDKETARHAYRYIRLNIYSCIDAIQLLYLADQLHLCRYGRTISRLQWYKHANCPVLKEAIPATELDIEHLSISELECLDEIIYKFEGDVKFPTQPLFAKLKDQELITMYVMGTDGGITEGMYNYACISDFNSKCELS